MDPQTVVPTPLLEPMIPGWRGLPGRIRNWAGSRGRRFLLIVGAILGAVVTTILYPAFESVFVQLGLQQRLTHGIISATASAIRFIKFPIVSSALIYLGGVYTSGIFVRYRPGHLKRRTAHNEDELERALGIPIIGTIPRVAKTSDPSNWPAALTESLERLRSILVEKSNEGQIRIMVTSADSGVGKSTCVLGLARSFAFQGLKVLLIDGDLWKPAFVTGIPDIEGLTKLLSNEDAIEEYILNTQYEFLSLLPAGQNAPNPGALLGAFCRRLHSLKNQYDVIIVDSAPGMSGTIEMARYCGTVLYIHSASRGDVAITCNGLRTITMVSGVVAYGLLTMSDQIGGVRLSLRTSYEEYHREEDGE